MCAGGKVGYAYGKAAWRARVIKLSRASVQLIRRGRARGRLCSERERSSALLCTGVVYQFDLTQRAGLGLGEPTAKNPRPRAGCGMWSRGTRPDSGVR